MSMPFNPNQYGLYDEDGLPVSPAPSPALQPPVGPMPMYVAHPQAVQQKSWMGAVLLTLFLGNLGVHNFYLGYTGRGVAQLALTVLGWATAVLLIGFVFLAVVGLWVFVDFVRILMRSGSMGTDSRGVPLN